MQARCRTSNGRFVATAALVAIACGITGGCHTALQVWDNPPPPELHHGDPDADKREQLRELSTLSLRRARAAATSAERVVWYGRAGIAQYRMQAGKVPLELEVLRDDPTGMVAADIVADSNDLQRRHHPHLFDCTTWLRQVPEAQKTPFVRAWAAHCAFRTAEVSAWIARQLGLPPTFDGTMPRRLRALGDAIELARQGVADAQRLANEANEERLAAAAMARLVMLYADFSARIVAVPMPETYKSAPETAALLQRKQREIALPLAEKARRLLGRLNRMPWVKAHDSDPWVRAARKAVLRVPRE